MARIRELIEIDIPEALEILSHSDPRLEQNREEITRTLHLALGRLEESRTALESVTAQVPGYRQAHVLLASVYYRQKDKAQGDRHRDIAEKLRAEEQAKEPGAADDLGPAYRGNDPAPAPSGASKPKDPAQ